jgi:hypothetical protein
LPGVPLTVAFEFEVSKNRAINELDAEVEPELPVAE